MTNIAILASGSGSNAEAIIDYFKENNEVNVCLVISNNSDAGVLDRARSFGIPSAVINSVDTKKGKLLEALLDNKVDFVILAGYMKLIPMEVIEKYEGKILNIHPALLPNYGGKGMYGMNVHHAVVNAKEKETGMTIHYVSANYDEGKVLFQEKVNIDLNDTAETVQKKVLKLEHKNYPVVIEKVIQGKI